MSYPRPTHEHTRDLEEEREFLALHAQLLAMNTAFEAVKEGETGIELAMDAEALRRLARKALNRSKSPGHDREDAGSLGVSRPSGRKRRESKGVADVS